MYRVTITREDGEDFETVIEVAGSGAFLVRIAPTMIAEALAEAALSDTPQRVVVGSGDVSAMTSAVAATEAPAPPKRPRRTKAQIAADEAAQAAGFRDAAHQAEAAASGRGSDLAGRARSGAAAARGDRPDGCVQPLHAERRRTERVAWRSASQRGRLRVTPLVVVNPARYLLG